MLFSHPNVHAITYWDFSDSGAWLGAPAGLLHKDMTPKPAYTQVQDLIRHQWRTNGTFTASPEGIASMRAFCGSYVVTVTDAGGHRATAPLELAEAAEPSTLTITLK